jgi:hypothetical protein
MKEDDQNSKSGDPNDRSFFTQLSASDRAELLKNLKEVVSLEVDIAIPDNKVIRVKCSCLKGSLMLILEGALEIGSYSGSVEAEFIFNLNKYLLKSNLKTDEGGQKYLGMNGELFLVQRRKNFRVDVPVHIIPSCSFSLSNQSNRLFSAKVVNISMGGCLLAIEPRNNHSFQVDSQIEMSLSIEGGKVIEVGGVIRRVLSVHQQKDFSLRLGIEFERLGSHEESRINEIVMKCYRMTNRFGSRLRSM